MYMLSLATRCNTFHPFYAFVMKRINRVTVFNQSKLFQMIGPE